MTPRLRADIVNFAFFDAEGARLLTGGAERYVLELARHLAGLGFVPRILQNATVPFMRAHEGFEIVGVAAGSAQDLSGMSEGFNEAIRGAALVVASPVDLAAGLRTPAPVVGISHGIHWDYDNNRIDVHDAAKDAAYVAAVKACALCVCVDSNFPNWLRCFDADAAARTRRIPNFVDVHRFVPVPKRFDGRLDVLFPRRLCRERGFRDVVEAFDRLLPKHPAIDLHLCGEGPAEDEAIAAAFVARHAGRVRWSRLAMDEMPAAYAASHVVLVPTTFAEGTSLSCIEAMATRNAIVTTPVGGLADLVVDGWNALVVRPGADGIVASVERLVRDRALAERLATNALTVVHAFARSRWLAQWQAVLHEVLPGLVSDAGDVPAADAAPEGLEHRVAQLVAERDAARAAQQFAEQQHFWAAGELAGIKASTGWAVLQQLYRVRFALLPRGSRREALGKRMLHAARRLRHDASPAAAPGVPAASAPAVTALPPASVPTHPTAYALVVLPSIEWGFRMQRPQQLAKRFARAGHRVHFARHSFGAALAAHEVEAGIEEIELPGVPGTNPYRDRMSEDAAHRMADALLAHLAAQRGGRFVCVVQLPYWAPLAGRLRALTGCDVVYDCMDLHEGFSSNSAEALSDEARLFADADVVVCSSDLLVEHARPHARRVALVRNGVDAEHFAGVADRAPPAGGTLTIGYYGAIADWFDSELVAGIAQRRPQWRIVLVGSTWSAQTAPLEAQPNIALTGEKPYGELPALIADWDCCVIPFLHTPLTAATNPVKVYEMLAAGKPVVSVGLPELASMAREGLVTLAEGADAFVAAIEQAVASDDRARRAARRAFAAENTWEARRQAFDAAIAAVEPLVSVVIVTYNNRALNELCLASVLHDTQWPALEVIVVDNASGDDTPALLREVAARDPRVRIVLNEDNRGFAAANNQGAGLARGRYLCFLNNDTVVHGAWLRTLVGHLRRHAHLGLVGPVTNAIGNEAKIPVGYDDLAGMPAWADAHCEAHRGQLDAISMLAFFCVAVPRDVWRRVGPLDERFGTGMFEDDDYNRRVRESGHDVRLARDSFVHHWQRASFKLLGEDEYLRIYRENQARYAQKWEDDRLAPLRAAAEAAPATVIFAPSVGWQIPLAQRPHHIARVLAQDGYAVVFDCSNAADEVDVLREVEPRLFLYKGEPGALAGLPRAVVWVFSYNVDYRDAFAPDVRVVYDWIDDLAVFPYDQRKLASLHARAMREADVVVSVARRLHERAVSERPDARYVPNAVEEGRFEREPEPNPALADPAFAAILAEGKPIAGYYGALAHWFDYPLLAQAARRRPDWSFVLIGPDHDGSLARSGVASLPNVHALGPRAYASLPGYLHRFDVATIPFAINDITLATSPLKLYEYFAAGRPVISSPMPECMAFEDVRIVSDAAQFAGALDAALAAGRDPAHVARLRALAQANTWRARAREVMAALAERSAPTAQR
ncbi:MAG TPA: glycosyltransferase [Casimicrobiaceae bacterium]|nr:glycosyltransferase [Casimicrobiaceae bacterium]